MPFHHVAIATRDTESNHRFYTESMGFELVTSVVAKTPEGGWAKHFFYDTGGGELMAFWEIHLESLPEDWSPAISIGLGLPGWTNHIAFDAGNLENLEARKRRWLETGHDVAEIDHGWCTSIYTRDPNQILVEWCATTAPFDAADRERAQRMLTDSNPEFEAMAQTRVYKAEDYQP